MIIRIFSASVYWLFTHPIVAMLGIAGETLILAALIIHQQRSTRSVK